MPKLTIIKPIIAGVFLSLMLSACGKKAPLTLPDEPNTSKSQNESK
jgi:predicted small lipoprotein YifL